MRVGFWVVFSTLSVFVVSVFTSGVSWAESPESIVGATTVDVSDARQLFDKGAVFIDVRDALSYNLGHIPGAVHLDFNDDVFAVLYVSESLDRRTPVVFYCDSALASAGAMASFFAANWGYENVFFFRDGYYAWMASDFPIHYQMAQSSTRVTN